MHIDDETFNAFQRYVDEHLDCTIGEDRPPYSNAHLQMSIRGGLSLEEAADEAELWMNEEIAQKG